MPSRFLVGRERERAELAALVADATQGRGGIALVGGEPGVGKTHLVENVASAAERDGMPVAWATCHQGDAAPPLWPWSQVLHQLAGTAEVPVPELAPLISPSGLLGDIDPASARSRLFDQVVASVGAAVATGPLFIVIDDLQWADQSSLQLLGLLESMLRSAPLLLVGMYRSTEVDAREPLGELLADLPRGATRLDLTGLSSQEVALLGAEIAGHAIDNDLVAILHRHTAGNPFFITELLRLGLAQGRSDNEAEVPVGVREVLDRQVARRSDGCARLLGAASVIGREFAADLVVTLTGTGPEESLQHLDEAVTARVIVPRGPGQFSFVHDLFCQAVYEGLDPARRARLHNAAGEVLELRRVGTAAAPELAHHFLAAGPLGDIDNAVRYAGEAGEHAIRLCAFDQAVGHFDRALAALPTGERGRRRTELLIGLGDALWRSQQLDDARAVLDDAAHSARELDDADLFGRAALAYACGPGGDQDPTATPDWKLIAVLEESLAWLPQTDSALRCRIGARLAIELYLTPEHERRAVLSSEALEMARRLDDPSALAAALYARTSILFGPDELSEREEAAAEMLALARQAGDKELAYWAHLLKTWTLAQRGRSFVDELSAAAALAGELRVPAYQAEVAVRQAIQATITGDFETAAACIHEARAHTGEGANLPVLMSVMALDAWLRGPLDEVHPLIESLVDAHPDVPMWRAGLACLYAETGDADAAARHLDQLARADFDLPRNHLWLVGMHFTAMACAVAGSAAQAEHLRELVAPYADHTTIGTFCSMATTVGLLDGVCGRYDEALDWLAIGRDRNAAFGNRAFALWTEREGAALLLRRGGPGDHEAAEQLLTRVVSDLEDSGFSGLAVRAHSLLAEAQRRRQTSGDRRCELRREGRWWVASFDDHETPLPHAKGLEDIAALVSSPGQEIHAADLAGAVYEGSAGEVIDADARAAYKARIADLDDDIAEAEALGDTGRAEVARTERDQLVDHLSAALGLGGRTRRSGDTVERARKAVTWRIRRAIRIAEEADQSLGRHLDQTIRTGTYCSYQPDLAQPTPKR